MYTHTHTHTHALTAVDIPVILPTHCHQYIILFLKQSLLWEYKGVYYIYSPPVYILTYETQCTETVYTCFQSFNGSVDFMFVIYSVCILYRAFDRLGHVVCFCQVFINWRSFDSVINRLVNVCVSCKGTQLWSTIAISTKKGHLSTELCKNYTCIVLITKPSSGFIHTDAFISYYQLQLSYEPIYK